MMTTTAPKITYRKTRQGQWVAYGPASAITAGTTVTVTRASGETRTEYIASAGRPFAAGGAQMAYGYIGTAPEAPAGGCPANPRCPAGCASGTEHDRYARELAARLTAAASAVPATPAPLRGRCRTCRCHREAAAGAAGTILYDGCDRCGCEAS